MMRLECLMWKFESLGQWHDFWSVILLKAPDRFRDIRTDGLVADQEQALRDAFDRLRSYFHFARKKLKDERLVRIAEELIEMSLEAYLAGDAKAWCSHTPRM